MSEFHSRLKFLQEKNNIKNYELAEKIGVSVSAITTFRKGVEPSYDKLLEIAKVFDTTPNWLLGYSEDANKFNNELELLNENRILKSKMNEIVRILESYINKNSDL